ncbi:helix-turn-helix domain-containing protein [Streptomyces sp. A3M-1-3]|uniref:helix-turn-helix domain-containing protein n=1 Tax=Streptomyces sp. A3M-1-3 TaxID=2962044 RepID=UPI0020B75C5F|nr:helix-turn-helix domain-containing protein [Streptomyces sp. A3M-1-3]MCP3822087.1 helix-turn-helix domain-containing protein [Streptomyces sp. A3M-1-3]
MAGPRRDTRGIVDAPELFARVRFRRREPAEPLRPYLEHYWLIDWDLAEPYASHVVPHPSVNIVFQRYGQTGDFGEVAGIGLELFTQKLEGRGRVCGIQFRPGGFRPFLPGRPGPTGTHGRPGRPGRPVSELTGRRIPLPDVFPSCSAAPPLVLGPEPDDARVAALDDFLLALHPVPDPQADRAMALADRIRRDRSIRRVAELADAAGLSTRSLQRLFAAYVGVSPKWVILRYRIHEALERAGTDAAVDWAGLATELGYSDQAHLVRDFTARVGVPPTAYAQPQPQPQPVVGPSP